MKIKSLKINNSFLFENEIYEDNRGYFIESWNRTKFKLPNFVQDNHTYSKQGVLRGLHYQVNNKAQGKLVRCIRGSVYDVIVDLRVSSSTYGKWFGIELNCPNQQLWVPKGLAHGFYTLSTYSIFQYKVTNYYDPDFEKVLMWNDKELSIDWPLIGKPILSSKDKLKALSFKESPKFNYIL